MLGVINRLALSKLWATGKQHNTFLYQNTFNSTNYLGGTGTGTVQSGLAITNLVNFNKDISWEEHFQPT
jgi:hypothetical protein